MYNDCQFGQRQFIHNYLAKDPLKREGNSSANLRALSCFKKRLELMDQRIDNDARHFHKSKMHL